MLGRLGRQVRGGDQTSPQRAPEEPGDGWQRHSREDRARTAARGSSEVGSSEVGTSSTTDTSAAPWPLTAPPPARADRDWSVMTVGAASRTSGSFFSFLFFKVLVLSGG